MRPQFSLRTLLFLVSFAAVSMVLFRVAQSLEPRWFDYVPGGWSGKTACTLLVAAYFAAGSKPFANLSWPMFSLAGMLCSADVVDYHFQSLFTFSCCGCDERSRSQMLQECFDYNNIGGLSLPLWLMVPFLYVQFSQGNRVSKSDLQLLLATVIGFVNVALIYVVISLVFGTWGWGIVRH